LVDFEVFRWNLENATKVPEDIHRRQGLSGVRPCLWPRVDHKGVLTWSRVSIGCVGEVFEVTTQIDLGLTSVSRFDSADSVISGNNANQKPGASQNFHSLFLHLTKWWHKAPACTNGFISAGKCQIVAFQPLWITFWSSKLIQIKKFPVTNFHSLFLHLTKWWQFYYKIYISYISFM
jgi:hypothetical protein